MLHPIDRDKLVLEYKIIKAYCVVLSQFYKHHKTSLIDSRNRDFPEISWMYRNVTRYRSSINAINKNTIYERYAERIIPLFKSQIYGSYRWRSNMDLTVGMNVQFSNRNKRSKGQRRDPDIILVLRPTYENKVINNIGVGQIKNKFIFDAQEVSINHDKIRIFIIKYADIYDDTEISIGYLSMTIDKKGHTIRPTLKKSVRAGQLTIKNRIQKMLDQKK